MCWGCLNYDHGQCIVPTYEFKKVEAGDNFTIGLTMDGTLVHWGLVQDNYFTPPAVYSPTPSGVFSDIISGQTHICGIRENGDFEFWGANDFGQCNESVKIEN